MNPTPICVVALLCAATATASRTLQQEAQSAGLDFMLPVPGGTVTVGQTAGQAMDTLEALHPPPKPNALPINKKAMVDDARRLMSTLGPKEIRLEPFVMSRNVITMKQYEIFVRASGHRFPFDWWRYGEEQDYNDRLREINKEFPDLGREAPLAYWKAYWQKLPWKIPEEDGKPMDDFPVVYVSWQDAVAFAAWAGMRLPTEAEWIYAASGTEQKPFLWGNDLSGLKVKRGSRYDKPLPVGAHGEATQGPFGHQDMCLHVFEWVGDPGFFPFDKSSYEREREKLLKDSVWRKIKKDEESKIRELLSYEPRWAGPDRIAKGGWYGSTKEQLLLALRAHQGGHQVRGGLGFRVAKSPHPARDIALSKIRLDYDMSYFGEEREPNLEDQIGVENYRFTPEGLIAGYDALSFVPINHMGKDNKDTARRSKLEELAITKPQVIGTLITTKELVEPAVKAGTYTVLYRHHGTPKELTKAWKDAKKAITKAKKKQKDGEELKLGEGDEKWLGVLRRFGLKPEDVTTPSPEFIRLSPGKFEIPLDARVYTLRDNSGYVAHFPAVAITSESKYENGHATVQLTGLDDTNELAKFEFGVPTQQGVRNGKVYAFKLNLKLDWN